LSALEAGPSLGEVVTAFLAGVGDS
jgi:hypothetical protein